MQRSRIVSAVTCLLFLSYSYGEPLISVAATPPRITVTQLLANPTLLQQYIQDAYNAGDPSVTIPAGIYRLAGSTQSPAVLSFTNLRNFTINATGATIVATDVSKNVLYLNACNNVTINGGLYTRDPIGFSQGTVTAIASDHIDVTITPGYPTDLDQPDYLNVKAKILGFFDPTTRDWVRGAGDAPFSTITRSAPGSSSFHFSLTQPPPTQIKVGDLAACRGMEVSGVNFSNCQNLRIMGITVENSGGFSIFELFGAGNNYYNGCKIIRGPAPAGANPKDTPLYSGASDGYHSADMLKGPTYENCYVEFNDDDAIAIQGDPAFVTESHGTSVTVAERDSTYSVAVGDPLRIYDTHLAWVGDAKVMGVTSLSNYTLPQPIPMNFTYLASDNSLAFLQIQLDHAIPAQFSWIVTNANASGDGAIIRGTTVHHNRNRGMLIKASNVLIENNTVDGSTGGGIVFLPEILPSAESDFTRNTTIRQNTIENIPTWSNARGGLDISEWLDDTTAASLPGGHQDILVEGNTFKNVSGVNVILGSAERVTFCKNEFIQPMVNNLPTIFGIGNPGSLYWVTQSSGVIIENNQIVQPGPFYKTPVTATSTTQNIVVQ